MPRFAWRRFFTFCWLLLLPVIPAAAQFNAAIGGTVTDPSGATVPNAKITLTSAETHNEQTTHTSGEGVYQFDGLAPGRYTITVEAPGFKQETNENIQVLAEQTQSVNLTLTPGQVTESVTVSAENNPAIETENADVGGTLTTEQVERLPQIRPRPLRVAAAHARRIRPRRARRQRELREPAQHHRTRRLQHLHLPNRKPGSYFRQRPTAFR